MNSLPSETIPDQSMTIREMLARHQAGLLDPFMKGVQYWEDIEEVPLTYRQNFDLTDLDQAQAELDELREEIKFKLRKNEQDTMGRTDRRSLGDSAEPNPEGARSEEHRTPDEAQPPDGGVPEPEEH